MRPLRGLGVLLLAAVAGLTLAGGITASAGTSFLEGIPQRGTVIGQKTANVTLIQFEDLACTHCRDYTQDAFPTVIESYVRTGLVKVDFRGLGVVTRASEPALRYTLAAARQQKLWQVAQLFLESQSRLNELATDSGVRRLVAGVPGLNAARLVADARSESVRRQAAAHAAEAKRRDVPGTPWFFVKVGTAAPRLVRPGAYDADAFRDILDEALGR